MYFNKSPSKVDQDTVVGFVTLYSNKPFRACWSFCVMRKYFKIKKCPFSKNIYIYILIILICIIILTCINSADPCSQIMFSEKLMLTIYCPFSRSKI